MQQKISYRHMGGAGIWVRWVERQCETLAPRPEDKAFAATRTVVTVEQAAVVPQMKTRHSLCSREAQGQQKEPHTALAIHVSATSEPLRSATSRTRSEARDDRRSHLLKAVDPADGLRAPCVYI